MRNILTKEQVLLLEQAVDWDKSALGILTNALLRPISFLKGSIKKGIKKQQMNTLVKQWGLEYVEAIKKVDGGAYDEDDDQNDDTPDDNVSQDDTLPTVIMSDENKTKYISLLEKDMKEFGRLVNIIKPILQWKNVDIKIPHFVKLKSDINASKFNIDNIKNVMNVVTDVPNTTGALDLIKKINTYLAKVNESKNMPEFLTKFNNGPADFYKETKQQITNLENISDIYELFIATLKGIEPGSEPRDTQNATTSNTQNSTINNIQNNTQNKPEYKEGETVKYKKKDGSEGIAKIAKQDNVEAGFTKLKGKNSEYVIKTKSIISKGKMEGYYFINEAGTYELPDNITNLLSEDEINRLKELPDIKEQTSKALNLERLNTIKYEANYLINRAKNSKDTEDQAVKLQRIWDLGVQNTNDYFQDVIDIDRVKTQVKGETDANTKKEIESDQEKLDNIQKMGISEAMPVGENFDPKKMYAFDGLFYGQNDKAHKVLLIVSPATAQFSETNGGSSYFWFKVHGSFKYNKKENKVIRSNFFYNYTQNNQLVTDMQTEGDAVYIAFTNLRPSKSGNRLFVYSGTGKYYYNGKSVMVDNIQSELMKQRQDTFQHSIDTIAKFSNVFKLKISQRFIVDDEAISNNIYPGISAGDASKDKGVNIAKDNHSKLIKIMSPVATK